MRGGGAGREARRGAGGRLGVVLPAILALALGCGGASRSAAPTPPEAGARPADDPPAADAPGAPRSGGLDGSLVELGSAALARGEIELAEQRLRRALQANPDSAGARVGLARVALARDQDAEAARLAREALERDPQASGARVVLAETERRAGREAEARRLLEATVRADPRDPWAHAALAELTRPPSGPVPEPDPTPGAGLRHPYHPASRLRLARRLIADGRRDEARQVLAQGLWLADLDPAATLESVALLKQLDPVWASRRVVGVHAYADESVRADPAWKMRIRILMAGLSNQLLGLLDTAFLPVTVGEFSSGRARPDLDSLDAALRASVPRLPSRGVIAGFTDRGPPRRPGRVRLGQAEYLGRRMLVRLDPGAVDSRTLIHEVFHLYGAIHIHPDVDSLMNPDGDSRALDPVNARIVSLLRPRRFGPGGLRANVYPYVDRVRLTELLTASLRVNLELRRLELGEALEARESSRFLAAEKAQEAGRLDPELAQVASLVAQLLLDQQRFAEAARALDVAAALAPPGSGRQRTLRLQAERARRAAAARRDAP